MQSRWATQKTVQFQLLILPLNVIVELQFIEPKRTN